VREVDKTYYVKYSTRKGRFEKIETKSSTLRPSMERGWKGDRMGINLDNENWGERDSKFQRQKTPSLLGETVGIPKMILSHLGPLRNGEKES